MSALTPDLYYTSVLEIDLDALAADGITTLLVDLDNTLLPRDDRRLSQEILAWAREVIERGFCVYVLSNNWHGWVGEVAARLGFKIVPKALKPLSFGYRRAMRLAGASSASTAMIGDQLFTDVLGANLLGMTTVLVDSQSDVDPWHTLLLRKLERRILAGRQPLR